jgi:DNA-binding YbaB/EbfC family protein
MTEILKQAQQVQERMGELQRELAGRRFEASSGGGMTTAVVNGQLRVLEIRIENELVSAGDISMLQDLTAAAVNAALQKAQESVQSELQQLQGQLMTQGGQGPA